MRTKSFAMVIATGLLTASIAYVAPAMAEDAISGMPMEQTMADTGNDSSMQAPSGDNNSGQNQTNNGATGQNDTNNTNSNSNNSQGSSGSTDQGSPDTATGDDDY